MVKLLKSRLRRVEEGTTALIVSRDGLARNTQAMSCMDMFWRAYLPNARELPEDVASNMQGGWIKAAQRYSMSEGTVRKIIMALALTSTGRERGREDLVNRGWQLHSATLREVSSALQTKKTAQSNQLLATIRLFGIFEVWFRGPSGSCHGAWMMRDADLAARSCMVHRRGCRRRNAARITQFSQRTLRLTARGILPSCAVAAQKPL